MLETKNNIKTIKTPQNSNPRIQILENIKNSNSFTKYALITMKKLNSNHIDGTTGEDSKSSLNPKNKSKKRIHKKSESYKAKKKDKQKISKLLKNERLKIPSGKRMSIANNNIKLNLNNIEKMIKNLNKKKTKSFERKDNYGNVINKENKKNVHIKFLDNIPKQKLINIVPIESFKEYNMIEKIPEEEFITLCSKCCQIF